MRRFREGSGRICLDYVRTLRYRNSPAPVEELTDPEALAAWIVQFGPWGNLAADPDLHAVKSARTLREAIFRLVDLARAEGTPVNPSEGDRAVVNSAAGHDIPVPGLGRDGRLTWTASDPVVATLAMVARDALDLITSPIAARVRECAGENCQAFFVDLSRPGQRRWCSMDTCGNRAKKRNLRARDSPVHSSQQSPTTDPTLRR